VARKIHFQRATRNPATIAALRLRGEMGINRVHGPAQRVKKIYLARSRMPVVIVSAVPEVVKIIHGGQNLGSRPFSGTQPVQIQCV
jgi:hypothetical protein